MNNVQLQKEKLQQKAKQYKQFREERSKKAQPFINENIFFIIEFTEKKFNEELNKLGHKPEDILSLGAGAFCTRKNYPKIKKFFEDQDTETQKYTHDENNFYGAFYCELWNNEYYLAYDLQDVVKSLGMTKEDIKNYPLAQDVINIYIEEFEELNCY